jgi:hypothetical protein
MRLGGQVIESFCNINDFEYSSPLQINEGNATRVYLQLVDLNRKLCSDIDGTCYLRYMPPSGSSLKVTIDSIDDSAVIEKNAVQVAGDASLFYFDIYANESLGSGNLHLQLTEPGPVIKTGVINDAIAVNRVGPEGGQSFC